MPTRCCVPKCQGNYPNGPKVSVYSFPMDEDLKHEWIKRIQRKDFYPNKNSRVCEQHFIPDDLETEASGYDSRTGNIISAPLKIRRLKKTAIPSIFLGYTCSNSSNVPSKRKVPEEKRAEREMAHIKKALNDSLSTFTEYNESREINNYDDLLKKFQSFEISNFWTVYPIPNVKILCLIHIEPHPEPFIQYAVKINENLELTVSFEKNCVTKLSEFFFPLKVSNLNHIVKVLDYIQKSHKNSEHISDIKFVVDLIINLLETISSEKNENIIKFIQEQLKLLLIPNNNFRYSSEFLVFTCILHSISPHAYKFFRQSGNITMPHPDTLKRVCNNLSISPQLEIEEENFLMYIASRVNYIKEHEKTIVLLLDEIHIKPFFDYKGGTIVGAAFNSNEAASSAFVFMISSVLSAFKEVVHIVPVHTINFQTLYHMIKKVIIGLEKIGLKVICIVTDNNAINGKAMSLFTEPPKKSFVYPHPIDSNRPLFFLIDSVHLFKNIRNNWLNQKNPGICLFYPDFENPANKSFMTASFSTLKKLHDIENNELVKYARGLTLKSISPSNLERQNVQLVLKIFNKFVIEGLLKLGPLHDLMNFEGTAKFIEIICKWWNILNVRTTTKGFHQRNELMSPLTNDEFDEKNMFLNKFLNWLQAWEEMKCTTGALSKETHRALVQTTHGMMEFCQYCIVECKMKYILPGKIQTDCLEARFGKYRQMAGSQYNISMRQLLECEKKLRLQSCVKLELTLKSFVVPITNFDETELLSSSSTSNSDLLQNYPPIIIDENDIAGCEFYLPVLTYLGGFCCYSILKKLKCEYCKDNLTLDLNTNLDQSYNLIKNLDRGGLKCPNQIVVSIVLFNYIVVNKLYSKYENQIQKCNQRQFIMNMTTTILNTREIILEGDCLNKHNKDYICKLILKTSTNILLKNLCLKENDMLTAEKENRKISNKKRKINTLK